MCNKIQNYHIFIIIIKIINFLKNIIFLSVFVLFTIYADLECLLIKQQSCQNNPNDSYTEKKLFMNLVATH